LFFSSGAGGRINLEHFQNGAGDPVGARAYFAGEQAKKSRREAGE